MKAHIFAGPLDYDTSIVEPFGEDDLVIGADQGALFLEEHKLRCDIALGDFDSIPRRHKEQIESYAHEIVKHPVIKDFTDTYLAVQEAFLRGYDEVVIYGGIGRRFDHSYANMKLLELGDITIKTKNEVMYTLDPGTYDIKNDHRYLSLFALEDVTELTLDGFFYELDHITLSTEDPLCISNQGSGTISFQQGLLLVIHQNE